MTTAPPPQKKVDFYDVTPKEVSELDINTSIYFLRKFLSQSAVVGPGTVNKSVYKYLKLGKFNGPPGGRPSPYAGSGDMGSGIDIYYDFENDKINYSMYPQHIYLLGTQTNEPKVGDLVTIDDAKEQVYEITEIDATIIKMSDGNSEFTLNTLNNEITPTGVVKVDGSKEVELKKEGFSVKGFFKSFWKQRVGGKAQRPKRKSSRKTGKKSRRRSIKKSGRKSRKY